MQVSNFILEGLMQIVVAYFNAYISVKHIAAAAIILLAIEFT